ncbi:MAG: TrmH family RNA methyltransferase [Pseudomonadota bacterium]
MRLVLFCPEIAQNAGAATRAAACFGAELHIIEPCGFPLDAKGFKRTAMDYGLLAPPTVHSSWQAFDTHRHESPGRLVLMTTKASESLWASQLTPNDYIFIGRESAGVPDWLHERADLRVRIPISEGARSLNAATTAAIALAEARRQQATMVLAAKTQGQDAE